MSTYEFTVILMDPSAFAGDDIAGYADRLFERFEGDVNPIVVEGRAMVDCSIESHTFDEALSLVLGALRKEGLEPSRVEIEAETIAAW